MLLENVMEEIITKRVEDIWDCESVKCKCDKCKQDVISLTLNHVKPRYVSSPEGRIYVMSEVQNGPQNEEINTLIEEAVQKVGENPKH